MKKYKNKIIIGALIFIVLAVAYFWGGNAPSLKDGQMSADEKTQKVLEDVSEREISYNEDLKISEKCEETAKNEQENDNQQKKDKSSDNTKEKDLSKSDTKNFEKNSNTDKHQTETVLEKSNEFQSSSISNGVKTCTLSVRCDTVLQNISWLDSEKAGIVPKDGVLFEEREVTFYEGESVFNVLLREMKKNKIHLEFTNTPIYGSAYIEGIGNLYEFDCGELSGWMYKVNGIFPNYGCSKYSLKPGDKVEWVYTCDLGIDVGSNLPAGKKQKDE